MPIYVHYFRRAILTRKVCQTDLVFGKRSGSLAVFEWEKGRTGMLSPNGEEARRRMQLGGLGERCNLSSPSGSKQVFKQQVQVQVPDPQIQAQAPDSQVQAQVHALE